MRCPTCNGPLLPEPPHIIPNGRWQCTACFTFIDSDGTPMAAPKRTRTGPVFRPGEIWLDRRGRRHQVFESEVAGLVLLSALDHQLVPECRRPADIQGWRKEE